MVLIRPKIGIGSLPLNPLCNLKDRMSAVAVAAGTGAVRGSGNRLPVSSRGVWWAKANRNSAAWHCNPTQKPKGKKGMMVAVARVFRSKRPSRPLDLSSSASDSDPALDINSLESSSVRLIDGEQKMVGILSTSKAIEMAEEAELDLVILSGDADPPVVRIMDYRKHKYEQQKKKRDQQKKSSSNRADIKELKMGFNIDVHDYDVRLRAAKRFLKDGDKVKFIVQFKGRKHNFRENTVSLFEKFENDLGKMAIVESKNFADKIMSMVLQPKKGVLDKSEENASTEQISDKIMSMVLQPNKGVLDKSEENASTEQVSAEV